MAVVRLLLDRAADDDKADNNLLADSTTLKIADSTTTPAITKKAVEDLKTAETRRDRSKITIT